MAIELWQAAQDVINAEADVTAVEQAAAQGQRHYGTDTIEQARSRYAEVLVARRAALARIVGEDEIDAAVAKRRADVEANRRRPLFG